MSVDKSDFFHGVPEGIRTLDPQSRRKQTKRIFQPIKKPITKEKTPLLWAFLLYRQSFHYVYYFSVFIAISIAFTVKLPSKYRQKKSFKKCVRFWLKKAGV